jgi:hypothetical protein
MNRQQITKEMLDFNKMILENTFIHAKTEKMLSRYFEKAICYPETEKKSISEWVNIYKKNCADFQAAANAKS